MNENVQSQDNISSNNRMLQEKDKYLGPYEIMDLLREGSSSKI